MKNYSYLKPPSKFIKNQKFIKTEFSNGQRNIFEGPDIKLTNQQSQALLRFREYLKHKNPNKQFDDRLLLRYCHLGHFRTNQSVEKYRFHQDWQGMPSISKDKERGILHSGVFYCYGKDDTYSPNIYFNPARVDLINFKIQDYLVCLRTLLTPIEENMLIPGKIEKWNIIIDNRSFDEKKLQSNYSIVVNNLIKIQNSYPYRAKNIFVIQPGQFSGLWSKIGFISNPNHLVEEIIRQLDLGSICTKIYQLKILDKYIPRDQRQRQFGGTLQNLSQFWPITSTNRLMEVNSKFIDASYDSEQQYQSILNDQNATFFKEIEEKKVCCNFKDFCSIQ